MAEGVQFSNRKIRLVSFLHKVELTWPRMMPKCYLCGRVCDRTGQQAIRNHQIPFQIIFKTELFCHKYIFTSRGACAFDCPPHCPCDWPEREHWGYDHRNWQQLQWHQILDWRWECNNRAVILLLTTSIVNMHPPTIATDPIINKKNNKILLCGNIICGFPTWCVQLFIIGLK